MMTSFVRQVSRRAVPFSRGNRRGVVLIITLVAIVLITILILAFFSRSTLNRQISFSSTNIVKADLLARSSLDIITGELRNEITDSARSTYYSNSGATIYIPKTGADLVPAPLGLVNPTGSIVKVSASNIPIRPNGTITGSAITLDTPSLNGRSLASWFSAASTNPQLGANGTLPTWIFTTRNNGVATPASISTAKDPANADYVVGRFAYTIYDLSQLLDANTAGYPSADAADVPYKSSLAYADLTQLPSIGTGNQSSVDSFVKWRNGDDDGSASAYRSYLQTYGSKYGFLQTELGDNAFLSRQDLINFAKNGNYGLTSPTLDYLTHFSRAINAPSWNPLDPPANGDGTSSTIDYASLAEKAPNPNRDIPNVRFAGSNPITHYPDDQTPTETYSVTAGAPLIQRRFSLAKLVWLTYLGPSASLSATDPVYQADLANGVTVSQLAAGTPSAIQSCFGLAWNSAQSRWEYVGSTGGSTIQSSIETLDLVASEYREPNFFELRKAGILSGSLGLATQSGDSTFASAGNATLDASKDLHVLRIGANIIDGAKSDNYPAILALKYNGTVLEVAGQEDLPDLYCLHIVALRQSVPNTSINSVDLVWVPIFLNVNRTVSAAVTGPSSIVADIPTGTLTQVLFAGGTFAGANPTYLKNYNTPLPSTPITVSLSTTALANTFRSAPQPATSGTNSIASQVSYCTDTTNAQGWLIYSYENQYGAGWPAPWPTINPGPMTNRSITTGVMLRLRYAAPNGILKTYATFSGNELLASTTGITGTESYGPNVSNSTGNFTLNAGTFLANWDPRLVRFGPSEGQSRNMSDLPPVSYTNLTQYLSSLKPFAPSSDSTRVAFGLWPQGGKSRDAAGAMTNMSDPDGVFRAADGWLGAAANPYAQQSGTTFNTTTAARPLILHRPYRSVGELGYVFRDSPWKSLSFFDASSADSALLDLFSVNDEPAVGAGWTNLNNPQTVVQQALLSNVSLDPDGTTPLSNPGAIASAYTSYSYSLPGGVPTPTAAMPANIAQLANFISTAQTSLTAAGLDSIKYHQEGIVRALAGSTQSRTWNLLIDVVAQTGRYPSTASSLSNFYVEGEKRYWLSIAIDRITGKIVDQQLEPVND